MAMLPMANKSIAVMLVGVAVARILPPISTQKLAAKRSCTRIRNAAVCAASRARLASHARQCPVGSQKNSSTSTLPYHPSRTGPSGPHVHDARIGRTVVVCAQKSACFLDLDCPVPQNTSSGSLCSWGSKQKDLPTAVGSDSTGVSAWALLHRLLGSLCGGDPRGGALCCRQRDGRNRPCGAVEQHVAPTSGPFCAHDFILFQVGDHA